MPESPKYREYSLTPLRPSRKRIQRGDVFAFKPIGGPCCFGRVIGVDVSLFAESKNVILCYFYGRTSESKAQVPVLSRDDLLIAPLLTGNCQWTQGYFETVRHDTLTESDVLPVHCFKSGDSYFDDHAHKLPGPIEPVGDYGLYTQFGIAWMVCRALIARGVVIDEAAVDASLTAPPVRPSGATGKRSRKQSLVVSVKISRQRRDAFLRDLTERDEELMAALTPVKGARFDGHEIALDGSGAVFYLYGRDADDLLAATLPVLRRWRYGRIVAAKVYGPPGPDTPAEEVEVRPPRARRRAE